MLIIETFNLTTCHGQFDCSLVLEVEPAESFELIWDKAYVNGDEGRIYHAFLEGAKKSFSLEKLDGHFKIKVAEVKDLSGKTPPAAFQICIEKALAKLLNAQSSGK